MKKIIAFISFFSLLLLLKAQQIPLSSQYMMNRLIINPAYAGELGFYSASVSYRKQWVGLEGAPSNQNISIHGPALKGKLGFGLVFFRDVLGVSKENNISASFAYKIKNHNKKTLSFGISGSAVFTTNQWSQITTTNANDIAFGADSPQYIMPDFSAGIYYNTPKYYAGFSIPMFLQHELTTNSSSFKIKNNFSDYNYLAEAGVKLKLDDRFELRPSFLFRYLPNATQQLDINLILDVDEFFAFGFSYRTSDALVGLFQLRINDQIILGYSYDHTISELQQYNNGSHEIFLRYDFRYKVKSANPRFF